MSESSSLAVQWISEQPQQFSVQQLIDWVQSDHIQMDIHRITPLLQIMTINGFIKME